MQYIEYLNLPTQVALILAACFLFLQIVGEALEVKGRAVPEILKIRKYFARKKEERAAIREMPTALREVRRLLNDVEMHYSKDNITKRDKWMRNVDNELCHSDDAINALRAEVGQINEALWTMRIENMRSEILAFASHLLQDNYTPSSENFDRIFRLHDEYEVIIEEQGRPNGEIEVAHKIIKDYYAKHLKDSTFAEDLLGYQRRVR